MTDRYIEKVFLYLVGLSFLLHVAVFAVIYLFPEEKKVVRQEPVMVDLQDIPPSPQPSVRNEKPAKRQADQRRRFPRETAPRGEMPLERPSSRPRPGPQQSPRPTAKGEAAIREAPGAASILKPRGKEAPDIAHLMPSADRMAKLEEGYRKKYGPEVEEGDTKFLNADDIQFGSFLRRFETAVYGVWRYPREAAMLGIEGVTPVKITFNRKGEIEKVAILESSGSKLLDEEVLRTLRMLGPIGGFPKGYDKDTFNLIAFFQYGIIRGASRGMLH